MQSGLIWSALTPPLQPDLWTGVLAGGFLAFFAFIGFEDIVNMAEETHDADNVVPRAVIWTLVISVTIYVLVAAVAASFPDRAALTASKAPLAVLFEGATGRSGTAVAVMASIAMINGILVQIVMASRVIYGMANEGMVPKLLGWVHPVRQTPTLAILSLAVLIALLALSVPLLQLAELTSLIILVIFTLVNASLFLLGLREGAPEKLRRWRYWGLAGAVVSLALVTNEVLF
jgi:amino acid transporter